MVDASGFWADLTAIKHPPGIPVIEKALRIAGAGVAAALEVIRPEAIEIEASAAESTMRVMGSEMNPFIPVVASGANAAIWERVATHRPLAAGEMVMLDFGLVWNGYTGDFARTTIVGEPCAAQQAFYRAPYDALTAAIEGVRPGVLCSEVGRKPKHAGAGEERCRIRVASRARSQSIRQIVRRLLPGERCLNLGHTPGRRRCDSRASGPTCTPRRRCRSRPSASLRPRNVSFPLFLLRRLSHARAGLTITTCDGRCWIIATQESCHL